MPIRIRLAVVFVIGALVLVGVGGLVFLRQLHSGLDASLDTNLRTRGETLTEALPADLRRVDFSARATTGGVGTAHDAVAQLLDPQGRLVASTEKAGPRSLLRASDRARRGGGVTSRDVHLDHPPEPWRLRVAPVRRPDGRWFAVVGVSRVSADDAVSRVRHGLVIGGAVLVLLSGLGAWLLAAAALAPVERMRRAAVDRSDDDGAATLDVPNTHDEIAALARTMNTLLGRLQGALDRQRAFVADAGHELRTPLAVLRSELELAGRPGRSAAQLREAVRHAVEETDRVARLAENLLVLARSDHDPSAMHRETRPLAPILGAAVDRAQAGGAGHAIRLHLDVPDALIATVDAEAFRRAVDNVLDNALSHAPSHSTVEVSARRDDGVVTVEVADAGPGFAPEFLAHAFERFRRADASRSRNSGGAGLGLAIVFSIATAHGGSAEAFNGPDGGAHVCIRLPDEPTPGR